MKRVCFSIDSNVFVWEILFSELLRGRGIPVSFYTRLLPKSLWATHVLMWIFGILHVLLTYAVMLSIAVMFIFVMDEKIATGEYPTSSDDVVVSESELQEQHARSQEKSKMSEEELKVLAFTVLGILLGWPILELFGRSFFPGRCTASDLSDQQREKIEAALALLPDRFASTRIGATSAKSVYAAMGRSGYKPVVLFSDRAIEELSEKQLAFVIGHEIGHSRLFNPRIESGFLPYLFLIFLSVSPASIGLVTSLVVLMLYAVLTAVLASIVGVIVEHAADAYAAKLLRGRFEQSTLEMMQTWEGGEGLFAGIRMTIALIAGGIGLTIASVGSWIGVSGFILVPAFMFGCYMMCGLVEGALTRTHPIARARALFVSRISAYARTA